MRGIADDRFVTYKARKELVSMIYKDILQINKKNINYLKRKIYTQKNK